jgi:hypothetical protein
MQPTRLLEELEMLLDANKRRALQYCASMEMLLLNSDRNSILLQGLGAKDNDN